ncbi:MAG: hypothetical protein DSY81_00515 [Bacillota bacterium]|nr:MAG: hypothetical protein DSY92_06375 [Planctomycetota bacterium]RUA11488.1 MAG: hypothetical protein DSY81_00515 [Bacillota bacterium]
MSRTCWSRTAVSTGAVGVEDGVEEIPFAIAPSAVVFLASCMAMASTSSSGISAMAVPESEDGTGKNPFSEGSMSCLAMSSCSVSAWIRFCSTWI